MTRDEESGEQRRRGEIDRLRRPRVTVAQPETGEAWLLLRALLGGLALALLFNALIGLVPG